MKLTGKRQLVWEGTDVLVDIESTGTTTTEWTRLGVEGFEAETVEAIEDKIVEKELVKPIELFAEVTEVAVEEIAEKTK